MRRPYLLRVIFVFGVLNPYASFADRVNVANGRDWIPKLAEKLDTEHTEFGDPDEDPIPLRQMKQGVSLLEPSLNSWPSNSTKGFYDLGDPKQLAALQGELREEAGPNTFGTLSCECGREQGGGRIINGQIAPRQGFFPWILRILPSGCGGTLISDQWFVTAAHCLVGLEESPHLVKAQIRQYKLNEYDLFGYTLTAKRIAGFQSYNKKNLNADFALVQLSKPVSITGRSKIRPVCLPPQGFDYHGSTGTAQGWGVYQNGNNAQSPILRFVNVAIASNPFCKILGGFPADTHICGVTYGKGICFGDSGGPLTVKAPNGAHFLAGIMSGTLGSREKIFCDVNRPQFYTQASLYTNYIQEIAFSSSNVCSQ